MYKLRKGCLLTIRKVCRRIDLPVYYWAEKRLYHDRFKGVNVMPHCWYKLLFRACMRLNEFDRSRWIAEWTIHKIPYNERFRAS